MMLCTNGHNNNVGAKFCERCGVDTFQAPLPGGGAAAPFNTLSIVSFILSLAWVYWLGSILAIVLGYVSLRQIRRSGERGRGLAIAGIALAWIAILLGIGGLVLFGVVFSASNSHLTVVH